MNLILGIPDELATRLSSVGPDLERQALEALLIENFRSGRLNSDEVGRALGLEGRDQVDGFLKAHKAFETVAADEIESEAATLARLGY